MRLSLSQRKISDQQKSNQNLQNFPNLQPSNYHSKAKLIKVASLNYISQGSYLAKDQSLRTEKGKKKSDYRKQKKMKGFIVKKSGYTFHQKIKGPIAKQKIENTKFQEQNLFLKEKILDYQLKERDYVKKINNLEKNNLHLINKIERIKNQEKQKDDKEEKEFVKIMKQTFEKSFGIVRLHEIWKVQKEILRQWMQEHK